MTKTTGRDRKGPVVFYLNYVDTPFPKAGSEIPLIK